MPTAPPIAAEGQVDSADDTNEDGWLFTSNLVDVGWPKISMPNWRWKGSDEPAAPHEPGPITRMTRATRAAFDRTRTAWNNRLEKLKVGPFRSDGAEDEPGMFARLFGGDEPSREPESVAEAVGRDRPTLR